MSNVTVRPFARERIAVDGTVKALTAATYDNVAAAFPNNLRASRARIVVIGAGSISYTVEGTAPHATDAGTIKKTDAEFWLQSLDEIRNFKVTQGSGASSIEVTYYR